MKIARFVTAIRKPARIAASALHLRQSVRLLSSETPSRADYLYAQAAAVLDAEKLSGAAATDVANSPIESAIANVIEAASLGHVAAQGRLGRWLMFGLGGQRRNIRAALGHLHAAAVGGDVEASYWYGMALSKMDELVAAERQQNGASAMPDPLKDLTSPASGDEASRVAAGKAVIEEIKAHRRAAKAARARKHLGLPPSSSAASTTAPQASRSFESDDPAKLPLKPDSARAYSWLLRAASADHADAQVALGNLCLRMDPPDAQQGIAWYALAAQVSHHSLPGTIATAAAAAAAADGGDGSSSDVRGGAVHVHGQYAGMPKRSPSPSASGGGGGAFTAPDSPIGKGDDGQLHTVVRDADGSVRMVPTVSASADVSGSGADLMSPAAPNARGALPHPDALYNLGMIYQEGIEGAVPRDPVRALQYFQRAAELFDTSALFWLGHTHRVGLPEAGVRVNGRAAQRYLGLAASQGHPGAAHYLARLYRTGDSGCGVQPDPAKAAYFMAAAVEGGHAEALFELGDAHFHGSDGYAQDVPTALQLYERAGDAGSADALVSAGAIHYRAKDYGRAFELYSRAAEMGHVAAWENLAAMHATGTGVPVNVEAARYIRGTILPQLQAAAAAQIAAMEAQIEGTESSGSSSSGGGGGCGKSGGCGCKSKSSSAVGAPAAADEATSSSVSEKKSCGGNGSCGGSGQCSSKKHDGHTHDHDHDDGTAGLEAMGIKVETAKAPQLR